MPSKRISELEGLVFGTWEIKRGDHILLDAKAKLPKGLQQMARLTSRLFGAGNMQLIEQSMRAFNSEIEAKIKSKRGNLAYEFPYRTPAFPGCNKALIEIPLSSITAVADGEKPEHLVLQVASPANTYVGREEINEMNSEREGRAFHNVLADFSGGDVRSSKVHSLRFKDAAAASAFKQRLLSEPQLAQLPRSGATARSSARFTAAELQAAGQAASNVDELKAAVAAAKAAAAAQRQRRAASEPLLAPGFAGQLPASRGPWLSRCVQRWALAAPYDLSCSEADWEAYYKERAALDWLTAAVQGGWATATEDPYAKFDDDDCEELSEERKEAFRKLRWREDFPPPKMDDYGDSEYYDEEMRCREVSGVIARMRKGVRRRAAGCKQLQDAEGLAQRLAASAYLLDYEVLWEDPDSPRTIDMYCRLYSAAATTRCVELQLGWHQRARWRTVECFNRVEMNFREPSAVSAACPQVHGKCNVTLYTMWYEDERRYEHRKLVSVEHAQQLQQVLFGYSGLVSARKAALIAADAAGTGALHGRNDWVEKVARRQLPLLQGEETEEGSDDDDEMSDNEERRFAKPVDPYREHDEWDEDEDEDMYGDGDGPEELMMVEAVLDDGGSDDVDEYEDEEEEEEEEGDEC